MTQSSSSRNANLIAAFAVAVVDRIADAVEECGGSFGSGAAALLLIHHGHVDRIGDLREPLGLTQAGAVRLVDRLEHLGLVQRVARTRDDLRLVGVELTQPGSEMASRVLAARAQATASFLGSLSSNQIDQLARACETSLASAATATPVPVRLCRYCDEEACDLTRCPVEGAGVA